MRGSANLQGNACRAHQNSRWRVQLQISRGKACYEMGRQKEALYWHLHAWRMFLELLAADTQTETNTVAIERAIAWLERIKFEPELRKSEVSERLRPVVDQLDRITVVGYLGALAAEILLRLGHLLFVLNVGYDRGDITPETDEPTDAVARERIRRTLAFPCLAKAAECDPHSTLIGADLLKARFRFNEWRRGGLPQAYARQLQPPQLRPIDEHWPRGGNDYEQLARVAEYLMLKARIDRFEQSAPEQDDETATDAFLARDLLLSLFMSTDSINVRKSQIHRFLMKPTAAGPVPGEPGAPAIELICMRRYSSPFPLLPRPSAFRALGGGYFLRLHHVAAEGETPEQLDEHGDPAPFGVVIDPGVDFVENLYRTGYSLSDIRMIVITHDHVDHLGALEPLLSLIHVRAELLSKQALLQEQPEAPLRVKVLVSRSVRRRYEKVDVLINPKSPEVEFACLEDLMLSDGVLDHSNPFFEGFPPDFEILAMSSEAANGRGHLDLSNRPSHGVCIRTREPGGAAVAITSDTPQPPERKTDPEGFTRWHTAWKPALEADLLVVHLGSVPLTELRRIDSLDAPVIAAPTDARDLAGRSDEQALTWIREQLQRADGNLQGHIEYAQWLRSHVTPGDPPVTAELVGPVQPEWLPPNDHNYLAGLLIWSREYLARHPSSAPEAQPPEAARPDALAPPAAEPDLADGDQPDPNAGVAAVADQRRGRPGLFVIGELSEELGTMRGKVATRLNERVFWARVHRQRIEAGSDRDVRDPAETNGFSYALTADIGLHVCVTSNASAENRTSSCAKVLCTTCDLDSDRAPAERYHLAHDIYEVCVKGENEGIFYNCLEHDPARQSDPTFLEQLERFDIFGR